MLNCFVGQMCGQKVLRSRAHPTRVLLFISFQRMKGDGFNNVS